MPPLKRGLSRRAFLRSCAGSAAALSALDLLSSRAHAQIATAAPAERLLFVITATGGGSIVDSLLGQREADMDPGVVDDLLVYPNAYVSAHGGVMGGGFSDPTAVRAVDVPFAERELFGPGTLYNQSDFVAEHIDDLAVMTTTGTSVNHFVAQHRALTGAGVNRGRTLGEAVAERYGQSLALPYLNMGNAGYLTPGTDPSLPPSARGEPVVQPLFFAVGTDGVRGVVGAPGAQPDMAPQLDELDRTRAFVARARAVHDNLDNSSVFGQTYQCSAMRQSIIAKRAFAASNIEPQDLITKLNYLIEVNPAAYGLELSEDAALIRAGVEAMPGGAPARSVFTDNFLSQIVLAYFATRYGFTTACTIGPTFSTDVLNIDVQPPLSFDFSHQDHVKAQANMWARIFDGVDKLVRMLKATPTDDGGTMWDRSLIYIASDFGRDRLRASAGAPLSEAHSTGHNLSNGHILLSPLLNTGRVFGGVDPQTLLTYGFDRNTGDGDPSTNMTEADVYSVICQALGVEFSGRQDIPIMMAQS